MASLRSYLSLIHAGWVLVREGVVSALPTDGMPGPARFGHSLAGWFARKQAKDREQSERLSIALNKLGPSWVKLGQFLATRPDVVGKAIAKDLELLHDRIAPFDTEESKRRVEDSIGRPIADLYSEFHEPLAAASVAQVHKAVLKDSGETVAVKVIRPGIRNRFKRDLETFYAAAGLVERFVPEAKRLKPNSVVDTLAQSARIEMDLRLEAAAFSEMGENIKDDPGFRVPTVNWELTGRDCITMDWIDGIKLSEAEEIAKAGHDLEALSVTLIQSFLRHSVRDGFFHADMHPGNLFVAPDGDIVAVDMGIAGRLGKKERRFLAEILYGFIKRDYLKVAQVHFDAGYVPAHHDVHSFAQAIRAIGEPIHGQSAETISMAKLLTLLFEVTDLFDMETRPELIMLQKTMVVVEGVARTLDPSFNMWKTAEPVVGAWIARNLGPAGMLEDAKEGLDAARRLVHMLPEMAEKAEALSSDMESMVKNGMKLDPQTTEAIGKAEARNNRWGHIGIWALVALGGYWVFWG
ncbi:MAG: 2-polyprenylphenol 6-hydroxylase [Rhizobiaceae bacterium]|nr:2-polyprenylphenol 6-hydroxylase [Rhizobiaceae bacterium]